MVDYCNITNYKNLRKSGCFGKQSLPKAVSAFCYKHKIGNLVDICVGNGIFGEEIRKSGIASIATSYNGNSASEAIEFNLASYKESAINKLHLDIKNQFGKKQYITTCFDVVEHVDLEHIHNMLANLSSITQKFLITSISTRPSSRNNKLYSSILPLSTWMDLFKLAGFEAINTDGFKECKNIFPIDDSILKSSKDMWIDHYWLKANPFEDHDRSEPNYIVFHKIKRSIKLSTLKEAIYSRLDLSFKSYKRKKLKGDLIKNNKFVFNVHHFQDFFIYRSFLDLLEKSQIKFLLRRHIFDEQQYSCVLGFLQRNGISYQEYQYIQEIDWSGIENAFLLSASESTVAASHQLSAALVYAAKFNGLHTILFQHGVCVENFKDRICCFASDHIISWSNEHKDCFATTTNTVLGKASTRGNTCESDFHNIGSPKFSDSLICANPLSILKHRLGINTDSYDRVVLVGTNLHWANHKISRQDFKNILAELAGLYPDYLFILKLHPCEKIMDYMELKSYKNVYLLDDIMCIIMDVYVNRIMTEVDIVVSSLSTLLLDGAVAGKPVFQYDTGNALTYKHIKPVSLDNLKSLLKQPLEHLVEISSINKFKECYASNVDQEFYTQFSQLLFDIKQNANYSVDRNLSVALSLSLEIEQCLIRNMQQKRFVPGIVGTVIFRKLESLIKRVYKRFLK